VQGEGGYVPAPPGFLDGLRSMCDEHGILLVADEIQSGVGRTGRFWAIEHEAVVPDVVLAGKGLASGLPLGAIIARSELMSWPPGTHGSTFGGNPVSCAAALVTIDLVQSDLQASAAAMGERFLAGLQVLQARQPLLRAVRGHGLMIGLDFADHDTAAAVEQEAFRRGVLVLTCGERTVRLAPPLVIRADQVDTALDELEATLAAVAAR
jgi:4-aminobutyrate aminotransferase